MGMDAARAPDDKEFDLTRALVDIAKRQTQGLTAGEAQAERERAMARAEKTTC